MLDNYDTANDEEKKYMTQKRHQTYLEMSRKTAKTKKKQMNDMSLSK